MDKFETGSLVTRLTNDVTQLQNFVNMLLRMFLRSPGMLIGALIMGSGMSLIMTELQYILGSLADMAMLFGIIIGIVGGLLASFAYPAYNMILNRERKRIAPEIIRLTDELMK